MIVRARGGKRSKQQQQSIGVRRFPPLSLAVGHSPQLTWRLKYPSVETRKPRYSNPHLSLTVTVFPVRSCRNGLGLTGWSSASKVIHLLARIGL